MAAAAKGVLERALRAQDLYLQGSEKVNIRPVKGNQHWLKSTLEWLQKHNLYLWRGGTEGKATSINTNISRAMPRLPRAMLKRLAKDKITHRGDVIDDSSGDLHWRLPAYAREYSEDLPDEPPAGTELLLWPGQYWRSSKTISTARGRLTEATVMEIICVDQKNDTVVIKCWKPSERTARTEWYEAQETMEIPHSSLFATKDAIRVDAKGRLSGSHRCHFGNDRVVPRPLTTIRPNSTQTKWLDDAIQFCQAQPEDYIPRLFTDGTYTETDHDLHSVFESTAVRQHAAASVVILHDGDDWENRPAFAMQITDGDMIETRSA